jgi:hypothetical protein
MPFGLDRLFSARKPVQSQQEQVQKTPVETGPQTESAPDAEKEVRSLIAELDTKYGADEMSVALNRIFGTIEPTPENINLPLVSDELMKSIEVLNEECGYDSVLAVLRTVWQERREA